MKILIIIDMLNGFCRKGYPLSLPAPTSGIENYIAARISEVLDENGKVIFACDSHSQADPEIGNPYPPHCMEGSIEAEIVDTLKAFADKAIVLKKSTLSIFLNTGLEKILNELKPAQIEVADVCADISVLFSVYELRIHGYAVHVSQKGVLALDSDKQNEYLDYFKNRLGALIE